MKYIKLFNTKAQYDAFRESVDYLRPNVSFCIDENEAYIEKWIDGRIVITFDVKSTSEPTNLIFDVSNLPQDLDADFLTAFFTKMEIDGVELESPVQSYTFSTTGEHVVKYTPNYDAEVKWGDGQDAPTVGWDYITPFLLWGVTDMVSLKHPKDMTQNLPTSNAASLQTIEFPENIDSIVLESYDYCTNLTTIKWPKRLNKVSGFNGCTSLTNLNLPSSVIEIGYLAFESCTGLTEIKIPKNTYTIGERAFSHCTGLTSLTIPSNIKVIGEQAFGDCENIETLTVENGVDKISVGAFQGCAGLTKIRIPESVTLLGISAFQDCENLSVVEFLAKNCALDGTVGNGGNQVFYGSPVQTLSIGKNVETIPYGLFSYNNSLENILFEYSNTPCSIDSGAFDHCSSLSKVNLKYVTSIGNGAFSNCTSLSFIENRGDDYPVDEVPETNGIIIDGDYTNIGDHAFSGCTQIPSVAILSNCPINSYAFNGCTGITEVYMESDSSLNIGSHAFDGCTGIEDIQIQAYGEEFSTIGSYAFYNCSGFQNLSIGGMMNIGSHAFYGCTGMVELHLEIGGEIGDYAFANCTSLEAIYLYVETPPTLGSSSTGCPIYVPGNAVQEYKSAWPQYESRIQEN